MSTTDDLVTQRKAAGFERVYPAGEVPTKPPPEYPYVVIGYGPNAPVTRTANGAGDPLRRFWAQHFSRTSDALEDVADGTFAAFDGQAIDGDLCTQEIATLPDRDPNDYGVLTTTHTYRF